MYLGHRVQDTKPSSGFRPEGSRFWAPGLRTYVYGLEYKPKGSGLGSWGLGFTPQDLSPGVENLGLRV